MTSYVPPEDFTDKVMKKIRRIHRLQQCRLTMVEKAISGLPLKTLLSFAAVFGGIWNLARIYMMFSPAICK